MSDTWGAFEAECYGCGLFGPVNGQPLCESCAAKLERDLIRQRAWDYSWEAYALSQEDRERLRRQVIAEYGRHWSSLSARPRRGDLGAVAGKGERSDAIVYAVA